MFSIRSYQKEDLQDVLEFHKDTTWEFNTNLVQATKTTKTTKTTKAENPQILENYRSVFSLEQVLENSYTSVAESEGRLVGFASIFLNQHYIDCLYVDKDFRKNGIAQALLTTLEEKAIQENIEVLTVETSALLRTFFEKMGFHVVTDHDKKVGDTIFTSYIMNKELSIPTKKNELAQLDQ